MIVSNARLHGSMIRMTAVSLCRVPPVSFCLLITSASALGSVLDLVKHTFICLRAVSSDTLLCQHMVCPRVLNSSHAQMSVVHFLSLLFYHRKIHPIGTDCLRNTKHTWFQHLFSHAHPQLTTMLFLFSLVLDQHQMFFKIIGN